MRGGVVRDVWCRVYACMVCGAVCVCGACA